MTDTLFDTGLTQALQAAQTALAQLQRLGKASDAIIIIQQEADTNRYASIDADTTHNELWKRTAYAKAYTAAVTTLGRQLQAAATRAGTQDTDDAARVYGTKGLPGDAASLAISRRDAGDRVHDIDDTTSLQRLLATAVRNGDQVLAHAIAEKAITNGDLDTTNAFADAYPELTDAVERLWTTEQRKFTTTDLTAAWHLAALKPAAIANLQDYEIAAAAAGDTSVGRWSAGL